MLKSHFDNVEKKLLASSKVASGAGHPTDKGTPREAFVREFLRKHLSEKVAVGQGEIINANSKTNEKRNQIDVIVYRRDYPKLVFGGDISAFLAESVVATIEVKSKLDKEKLKQSILSAMNTKKLNRSIMCAFKVGYQTPSILSYVVAYDGPTKIKSVYDSLVEIHKEIDIDCPALGPTRKDRVKIANPSIDGVFVLGKGFLYFDNVPTGFASNEVHKQHPDVRWVFADSAEGNLFLLFLFLTQAISGISASWLDAMPYLKDFSIKNLRFGK
jgi:hypothetical protein